MIHPYFWSQLFNLTMNLKFLNLRPPASLVSPAFAVVVKLQEGLASLSCVQRIEERLHSIGVVLDRSWRQCRFADDSSFFHFLTIFFGC